VKGDELKALTVWVLSSFQLGGVSLTPDELEDEASKIMAHVDENTNGKLSFDEFEGYFRRTCKSTEKFRESKPRVTPQSPQRPINRSGGAAVPCLLPLQRRPPRRRLETQKRRRPPMRRPSSRQMEMPAQGRTRRWFRVPPM
jgi:hypothetical protein